MCTTDSHRKWLIVLLCLCSKEVLPYRHVSYAVMGIQIGHVPFLAVYKLVHIRLRCLHVVACFSVGAFVGKNPSVPHILYCGAS